MSRKNLNGVHIPHRKNTAGMQAIKMPPPATVTIPMSMHIGKPPTASLRSAITSTSVR